MKQFSSIEKLDAGILYILELASSLSVLLLAFGLIASMANVLTKGAVLTDHLWMQPGGSIGPLHTGTPGVSRVCLAWSEPSGEYW